MKLEKWKYKGKEVEVSIFEENEIEKNENIEELEQIKDLNEILKDIEVNDAN